MSERTSYEAGTPCWVDLGTPDPEAAAEFYGAVFGWSVEEGENPEETGGYRMAMRQGKSIAGVMKLMQEGQPTAWTTYIAVSDADATTARAREAGGNVLAEPMDVLDVGRMAILADPTGAVFGVWQPGTFAGAELVNEPGAFSWSELNTREPEGAKSFYGDVFGWSFDDEEFEGVGTYTTIRAGERAVGGLIDITGRVSDDFPANWLVYFSVEDTGATLEQARQSGGEVAFGPRHITGVGRFAVVQDPFGATFAVIAPSEEMEGSA